MIRIVRKYWNILIIPACLIIGLVRQEQIQTYQLSIGKPTMTGAFTLFSYIFIGICLTCTLMLSNLIGRSKLGDILKTILNATIVVIGLSLSCFLLLLYH